MCPTILVICWTISAVAGTFLERCELPSEVRTQIEGYAGVVRRILDHVVTPGLAPMRGRVHKALAYFVDRFGPRLSGTKVLEKSINYLEHLARKKGLKTSKQDVKVPYWTRLEESVTMLKPLRNVKIAVLGLGGSISTPKKGIKAQALVVTSFKDLRERRKEASGKIVVFATEWTGYPSTVIYRTKGAIMAASFGAVAVLIRSMTDLHMGVPHAGQMNYDPKIPKIPAACISVEDANMLLRMQRRIQRRGRGKGIELHVKLLNKYHGMRKSKNLLVDIPGWENEQQHVFVSGHVDSWDVGVGAMDDGGGAFISLFAPIVLKHLGLQARRTVRAVLWTAEEPGLIGARAYKKQFDPEDIILAIETDEGVFNPTGLLMHGSHKAKCILHEILQLLEPINATTLEADPSPGSDITLWSKTDVPTAALRNDNKRYFWYHHSVGDRMEVMDPGAMDRSLALFAAVSYIVADLEWPLPRNDYTEWSGAMYQKRQVMLHKIEKKQGTLRMMEKKQGTLRKREKKQGTLRKREKKQGTLRKREKKQGTLRKREKKQGTLRKKDSDKKRPHQMDADKQGPSHRTDSDQEGSSHRTDPDQKGPHEVDADQQGASHRTDPDQGSSHRTDLGAEGSLEIEDSDDEDPSQQNIFEELELWPFMKI